MIERAALLGAVAALLAARTPSVASGAEAGPLLRSVGGVSVDWAEGTIRACAGAAADYRMPSAETARPGAQRRAKAAAVAKIRSALPELAWGPHGMPSAEGIEAALARVREETVDYQSNGGVVLTVVLDFSSLTVATNAAEKLDDLILSVSSAPLQLVPTLISQRAQVKVRHAVYRLGAPPVGTKALPAKWNGDGRLTVAPDFPEASVPGASTGGVRLVIYVQKVPR